MAAGRLYAVSAIILLGLGVHAAADDMPPGLRAQLPVEGSSQWIEMFVDCGEGTRGRVACANPQCPGYNAGDLSWSSSRPNRFLCPHCGTQYPNAAYPEDKCEHHNGVAIAYHLDPDGQRHYFSARLRYEKVNYAVLRAGALAASGRRDLAVRSRDIMMALGKILPDFKVGLAGPEAGRAPRGIIKQVFGDYPLSLHFAKVADDLRRSGVIQPEHDETLRRIEQLTIERSVLPFHKAHRGVAGGALFIFRGLIVAARTFPDIAVHDLIHKARYKEDRLLVGPDLVHECLQGPYDFNNAIANSFHPDGFHHFRSPAYNLQLAGYLTPLLKELNGYCDPPAYNPREARWERIDNFDATPENPLIRNILWGFVECVFPDGSILPVGDTHQGHRLPAVWREELIKSGGPEFAPPQGFPVPSRSEFYDCTGLVALRCGSGEEAAAAYMTYGDQSAGHSHFDMLNLIYWCHGHELITDVGYASRERLWRRRGWSGMAHAHNLVIVDGVNPEPTRGHLDAFSSTPIYRVAQAFSRSAYPHLRDLRRTLVLAGDESDPDEPRYLVDVFHVIGGRVHDFIIHAQSDPAASQETFAADGIQLAPPEDPAITMLDFTPEAKSDKTDTLGGKVREGMRFGYANVTDVHRAVAAGDWKAQWEMKADRDISLRLIRFVDGSEEVFVGQAPGDRISFDRAIDGGKRMHWLCCRRARSESPGADATGEHRSIFASVVEAFSPGSAQISHARRVAVTGNAGADPTAIEVEHSRGVDLFVVARQPGHMRVPSRDVTCDGRVAVVSFDLEGRPRMSDHPPLLRAMMVDGSKLVVQGIELKADGEPVSGRTVSFPTGLAENPLEECSTSVEVSFEASPDAAGSPVIFVHTGGAQSAYRVVDGQRLADNRSRLLLDRSARQAVGWAGEMVDGDGTLRSLRLRGPDAALASCWVKLGDQWARVQSAVMADSPLSPAVQTLRLDSTLDSSADVQDRPFVMTRLGKGDRVRICNTVFGLVWPPCITPQEGDVTEGPITVALSTKQKKAQIRYTLDGSEPTDDSQRYAMPFEVNKACTVKARTFTTSGARSSVASAVFTGPCRPDPQPAVEQGLVYRYYEGEWKIGRYPDLSSLAPSRTGTVRNVSLDLIEVGDRHFAVLFEGFFDAPATDLYTFETWASSDFECKLFIGNVPVVQPLDRYAYARPRGFRSIGAIGLRAGKHSIRVVYVEGPNRRDRKPALRIRVGTKREPRTPLPSARLWTPKTEPPPTTRTAE